MFRSNDAAQELIFMVSAPVSTNGTLNMNVEKMGICTYPECGSLSPPSTLLHVKTHCEGYTKSYSCDVHRHTGQQT